MILVKDTSKVQCPSGIHDAVLQSVETREHEIYGEYLSTTFSVVATIDEDDLQFQVTFLCSLSLRPNSKLRNMVESIIGRQITNEEAETGFDVEKLIGSTCKVIVASVEGKEGNIYARVASVLPS